jgi:hypothetical protein
MREKIGEQGKEGKRGAHCGVVRGDILYHSSGEIFVQAKKVIKRQQNHGGLDWPVFEEVAGRLGWLTHQCTVWSERCHERNQGSTECRRCIVHDVLIV